MNGIQFAVFIGIIFAAVIYIPRAIAFDRNLAEYHLMHGPASGCVECEGK